jgi:protein-S-isoprenylcysteine O-methyltransferase Ste14
MIVSALSSDQVKNLSIGGIVAVVVIGLILFIVIKAIVGRVITVVVSIGLAVVFWTQRTSIEDKVKKCDANLTFLGAHVQLSQSVQDRCQQLTSR